MAHDSFVIGIDFGTDSVRSMLVNATNGEELATSVFYYPRWRDGLYCDPAANRFRQHPKDYIEGLEYTVRACLAQAGGNAAAHVKGISIDTTGSTPVAVDRTGTPLALTAGFEENPHAMFLLWKDHTSVGEAAEINAHAQVFGGNYLQYVGGIYSSEWYWAKLLRTLRADAAVRKACYTWVEHCDWIPFLLTGGQHADAIKRGVCAAGHKGLWSAAFDGYPPEDFFTSLDPLLKGYVQTLGRNTYTASHAAGQLSSAWAARLGLSTDVVVGIGAFDCHMGAVGGQIEPYYLSKVMGTSTCDMMVIPRQDMENKLISGICGQVDGSILPGMIGLEAGQSAFGDVYAWYKKLLLWPVETLLESSSLVSPETARQLKTELGDKLIATLATQAGLLPLDEHDELAVDWLNGRRTPDANQMLTGGLMGLSLGSDAPALFKAWVEATCFGAKAIADRFQYEGIPVKGIIALGGVARKAPYVMQVMANVMNKSIRIHRSEQTCALGAAMFAATAAGIHPSVEVAMQAMGQGFDLAFEPQPATVAYYQSRYKKYQAFGAMIEQSLQPVQADSQRVQGALA
jgi:L-ribulokinase